VDCVWDVRRLKEIERNKIKAVAAFGSQLLKAHISAKSRSKNDFCTSNCVSLSVLVKSHSSYLIYHHASLVL
jgi:hypothetical protein